MVLMYLHTNHIPLGGTKKLKSHTNKQKRWSLPPPVGGRWASHADNRHPAGGDGRLLPPLTGRPGQADPQEPSDASPCEADSRDEAAKALLFLRRVYCWVVRVEG